MSSNCQRCAKPVHPAERIGDERAYHKKCFTCSSCRKSLVTCSFSETGSSVYCAACFAKVGPSFSKPTSAPSKWTPKPAVASLPEASLVPTPVTVAVAPAQDSAEVHVTVSQRRASIGIALGALPQMGMGGFRPPVNRQVDAPAPAVEAAAPRVALPGVALPFPIQANVASIVSSVSAAPSVSSNHAVSAITPSTAAASTSLSHATLSRPVIGHHRRRSSQVPSSTRLPSQNRKVEGLLEEDLLESAPASSINAVTSVIQIVHNEIALDSSAPSEVAIVSQSNIVAPTEPTSSITTAMLSKASEEQSATLAIVPVDRDLVPSADDSPASKSDTLVDTARAEIESNSSPALITPSPITAVHVTEPSSILKTSELVKPTVEPTPMSAQPTPMSGQTILGKSCIHCGASSQTGAFCECGEPLPVPRSRTGSGSGSISLGQSVIRSAANSSSQANSNNASRKSSLAPGSEALAAALVVGSATPSAVDTTRNMFQAQAAVAATRLSFSGTLPRMSSSSSAAPVDPNRCVKCGKMAYMAEKMQGTSRTYHKTCFKCTACNKSLTSASNGFDRDGQVFCKACYK